MGQELILIRGLPGSGKSTLARSTVKRFLAAGLSYDHIETDMFFQYLDEYKFDPTKLKEAHKWAQDWCRAELQVGDSVIVSNTFIRIWEMQPYIDMSKEFDARLTVVTCEGSYGNVHGVPEEKIQEMKRRWESYPPIEGEVK